MNKANEIQNIYYNRTKIQRIMKKKRMFLFIKTHQDDY
jgi:hypothetical protein